MKKNCRPSMSGFDLIKEKTTSKTITKRYAETESPCLVPLFKLKYGVALPPLITHDPGFFIKTCIYFLNSLPNPNLFNAHIERMIHSIKSFFYIYCH